MRPEPFVPEILESDNRYVRNKTDGLVWHQCRNRTLYADTDRSRVVYHANYLRYFEFGRASLMRDTAYSYREIEESGYVYPILPKKQTGAGKMITYQNKVRKNTWIAWVLLSAGLIVTIYAFVSVAMNIDAEAKKEFEFACSQIGLRSCPEISCTFIGYLLFNSNGC